MPDTDLTTELCKGLTLRDPFWIASAHFSEKESVIDAWAEIQPAALTLKTAHKAPIDQTESKTIRHKTIDLTPRFARSFYCDGPKKRELITYEKASELLKYALGKLPNTKVGISVLCNAAQNYKELRAICPEAAFCELNLKYIFRFDKAAKPDFFETAEQRFSELLDQLSRFAEAFRGLPIMVKISRELTWMPWSKELDSFLDILSGHGQAGLIVANSLKVDVPVFISDGQERVLRNGVLCGECLFDQTISLIDSFRGSCNERGIPIVATGGMIDPEHILTAFRTGASAIQLCTAFDYYRPRYYNTLCWNLQNRIELLGLRSFSEYLSRLRKDSVATIYNVPFMYFDQFWSEDIQRRLLKDVRSSQRMDVFLMSGKTVVEKWREAFTTRFQRNLGLRILSPDPDGPTFESIQKSWGIVGAELIARRERAKAARSTLNGLWHDAEAERQKHLSAENKECTLEMSWTDQCPFYSFYLFDDKVCVAPYPFIRPTEPNIPVYIFFAGSHEYDRINKEAQALFGYAKQVKA